MSRETSILLLFSDKHQKHPSLENILTRTDLPYRVVPIDDGGTTSDNKEKASLAIIDMVNPSLLTPDRCQWLSQRLQGLPRLIITADPSFDTIPEPLMRDDPWDSLPQQHLDPALIRRRIDLLLDRADLERDNQLYKQQFNRLVEEKIIALQAPILETHKEIVSRLSDVIEMRSRETGNHVRRVAQISEHLAQAYGLDASDAETLRLAAPLHDIGKAGIPDVILNKNGKLIDDEFEIVKTHTTIGYEMLKDSEQPIIQTAAIIALQHHEHWDGSGYPQGLAGEEIHIFGRITCLADIYDVLLQKRQHKESWHRERALEYIKLHRGTFFDPDLVDLFLGNIDEITDLISGDPGHC